MAKSHPNEDHIKRKHFSHSHYLHEKNEQIHANINTDKDTHRDINTNMFMRKEKHDETNTQPNQSLHSLHSRQSSSTIESVLREEFDWDAIPSPPYYQVKGRN
jgi:hypothetical protein